MCKRGTCVRCRSRRPIYRKVVTAIISLSLQEGHALTLLTLPTLASNGRQTEIEQSFGGMETGRFEVFKTKTFERQARLCRWKHCTSNMRIASRKDFRYIRCTSQRESSRDRRSQNLLSISFVLSGQVTLAFGGFDGKG